MEELELEVYTHEELYGPAKIPTKPITDKCKEMALDILIRTSILYGTTFSYSYTFELLTPKPKRVIEDKIYGDLVRLLDDLKKYNEECEIPFEYYGKPIETIIEDIGNLNYYDMANIMLDMMKLFCIITHSHLVEGNRKMYFYS